jgi:hypothetical protein
VIRDRRPDVAGADFDGARSDPFEVTISQADLEPPIEHGHGRRDTSFFSDRRLAAPRRPEVVWRGEALADDRRLESDHGPAGLQRRGHLS